jgi:hypothetical protein
MKHDEKHYFASAHGEAGLFVESLDDFEAIGQLQGLAEGRRMAALREIENYRKALAERLRERSDNAIIDGEFSEAAPGSESSGNGRAKTQSTEADSAETEVAKIDNAKPDRVGMSGDRS